VTVTSLSLGRLSRHEQALDCFIAFEIVVSVAHTVKFLQVSHLQQLGALLQFSPSTHEILVTRHYDSRVASETLWHCIRSPAVTKHP